MHFRPEFVCSTTMASVANPQNIVLLPTTPHANSVYRETDVSMATNACQLHREKGGLLALRYPLSKKKTSVERKNFVLASQPSPKAKAKANAEAKAKTEAGAKAKAKAKSEADADAK